MDSVPRLSLSYQQFIPYNAGMTVQPVDRKKQQALEDALLAKAMPPASLGELGHLAIRLGLITEKPLTKPALLLFAADHGIHAEGVTHSPQEITWQQCVNFAQGGGACGLFAQHNKVFLSVIDVGVRHTFSPTDGVKECKIGNGTANFLREKAMSLEQCHAAMEVGRLEVRETLALGFDTIAFGEMGVANSTSASAIACALTGFSVASLTGKGSGLKEEELKNKIAVVSKALEIHQGREPVEVLSALGGFEIAAIAGGILEAARMGVPILLDGFIVTAAALISCAIEPACKDYLIPCHRSAFQGHALLLEYLDMPQPLLDLGMQLGEGTAALAAWPLVSLASRILSDMTSFSEAAVTDSTALLHTMGIIV